jgi:hypothetical protein
LSHAVAWHRHDIVTLIPTVQSLLTASPVVVDRRAAAASFGAILAAGE